VSLWQERQIAAGDTDYDPEYDAANRIGPDPLDDDANDGESWEPDEQPEAEEARLD
jgi:hypothetical protein